MYSYLDDYMLLTVTGGFNLGGGTENDAIFHTNTYSIGDDLTMIRGNHQFGLRRQRGVLGLAVAGQRAVAGHVHLRRRRDRPRPRRLPDRAAVHASSSRRRTRST